MADHHCTESEATPDISYQLDPARRFLSGNLFELKARLEDLIGSFQNEELALQDPVF